MNKVSANSKILALGLTDKVRDGDWVWMTDGSPVTWTRWAVWLSGSHRAYEPTDLDGETAVILENVKPQGELSGGVGVWADVRKDLVRRGSGTTKLVCQRSQGEGFITYFFSQ